MQRILLNLAFLLPLAPVALSQTPPAPELISPTVTRLHGHDDASNAEYTLLRISSENPAAATLTVQCTAIPNESQHFELFLNLNAAAPLAFLQHHPHLPTEAPLLYTNLTLDFRGYTHVKPFRREFEALHDALGELRYNPPGFRSHNLEEASNVFQYLRALPTLVVTEPATTPNNPHTATFLTAPLLAQIHKEALCKASGL